jgi:hypothetical protein
VGEAYPESGHYLVCFGDGILFNNRLCLFDVLAMIVPSFILTDTYVVALLSTHAIQDVVVYCLEHNKIALQISQHPRSRSDHQLLLDTNMQLLPDSPFQ